MVDLLEVLMLGLCIAPDDAEIQADDAERPTVKIVDSEWDFMDPLSCREASVCKCVIRDWVGSIRFIVVASEATELVFPMS
jgi:hypothetical protein